MGSASGPDDARPLDGDRDGTPESLNQTEKRSPDHNDDDRFYETDGVFPDSENDGYVDDTSGPVDDMLPEDPAAAAVRETVVAREEERFGGIKIGAALFGWLVSTAVAVLLVALVAAAGRAGFLPGTDPLARGGQGSTGGGMTGMIVLLLLQLLAYFSGGYVAGRMARFNGVGQGLMVWVLGVIGAAAGALLGIIGQSNVLTTVNSFLRLPLVEGQLSLDGIIAAIAVAATALIGAVLGGLAGVHYHRKVDRAGFTPTG